MESSLEDRPNLRTIRLLDYIPDYQEYTRYPTTRTFSTPNPSIARQQRRRKSDFPLEDKLALDKGSLLQASAQRFNIFAFPNLQLEEFRRDGTFRKTDGG